MKTQILLSLLTLSFSTGAFSMSHTELMWGLKNPGRPVTTSITPLQTFRLQAVAGEDIQLATPVAGRKIKVAVLDTGVDLNHPDLKMAIYHNVPKCAAFEVFKQCLESEKDENSAKCREQYLQSAKNVYPADCHGWSVLDLNITPTPNKILGRPDFKDESEAGHGTHVAGVIAAVSPNAEIIPVKVIGDGPNQPMKPFSVDLSPDEAVRGGYQSDDNLSERVARGIIYAMNSGAEVINFSMGWPEAQNSEIIKDAIKEAQNRGIIIVAAAGNDSTDTILRPCQYEGVICVAAHSPDGSLASFSNFGFGVDIAAPGVEIVSTIPLNNRSVRLPGYKGFDALSGTSQATPFVSGVIAEMLSRGIPAKEIYPRLILGARDVKRELPVLVGPVNGQVQEADGSSPYKKTILSGLLDMKRALQVTAQPLILPANKDTQYIYWDRKSAELTYTLKLKNYWQSVSGQKIQVVVSPVINSPYVASVAAVEPLQDMSSWNSMEEKSFRIKLRVKDSPETSRMGSEQSFQVTVGLGGKTHRKFEVNAAVLVNIAAIANDPDLRSYDLKGEMARGTKLTLVDDVFDGDLARRDYFAVGRDEATNTFDIALVRGDETSYQIEKSQNIKFSGAVKMTRPQYKLRVDLDGDGNTEYIYGLIEYTDKDLGIYGDYKDHFFVFDKEMKLLKTVVFDDKRAALPYKFSWMKINGKMRPAWIGKGQEVRTQIDLLDVFGTDADPADVVKNYKTPSDIHFYYLDENFKLQQVKPRNEGERIVEIIASSTEQERQGKVTVLIAKNSGTELKPSYISEFTMADITDGKLGPEIRLQNLAGSVSYRNLVDTYNDRTTSLLAEGSEYRGVSWYGLDSDQRQRVTLVDPETKQITDKLISSQRKVHDAALMTNIGFQSPGRKGVFLYTNSELEYHDLISDQVVSTSLNRYSFFGNYVELFFPIAITDRQNPSRKLPAVYNTEGSGLARGVRMLVPVYQGNEKISQIVVPARLRFKSEQGCKPLEAPVFLGAEHGYAMDYQCVGKILRLLLKY